MPAALSRPPQATANEAHGYHAGGPGDGGVDCDYRRRRGGYRVRPGHEAGSRAAAASARQPSAPASYGPPGRRRARDTAAHAGLTETSDFLEQQVNVNWLADKAGAAVG